MIKIATDPGIRNEHWSLLMALPHSQRSEILIRIANQHGAACDHPAKGING